MIRGFIGRPGAGKTYAMTHLASRHLLRGRPVFANFHLRGAYYYTPDQILDLPPGLVLMDEAHLIFGARNALRLPPSLLMKMSQTRKSGWDLWYSTQHERRVDTVVKDVTNVMTMVTPWFSKGGHPRLFQLRDWEPETFRTPKKDLWSGWLIYDQRVADLYNTFESLEVAKHMKTKTDIYDKDNAGSLGV